MLIKVNGRLGLLSKLVAVAGIAGLLTMQSSAQSERELAKLQRYLAPIGELCLAGEDCAGQSAAAATAAPASGGQASGGGFDLANTYQMSCFACHSSGAAGAPRTGDAAAWNSRIEDKGMDTVIANAINGIGSMPAKGMCMSCTEDQIRSLVDYMIEGGQ